MAAVRLRKATANPLVSRLDCLATNQGIQFPLVELQTQCEMLRVLIHKTSWEIDTYGEFAASDKVSMCNYWSNRLCCEAADRAMQVHGGLAIPGTSRSSTSTVTIAATGSRKARRSCRCAG